MPVQSSIDLVLERFEPLVAVKNLQLTEEGFALHLVTQLGEQR